MSGQRFTDRWLHAVREWLIGMDGPTGEQMPLPGLPEPPELVLARALPFVLVTYADRDGAGVRPGKRNLARVLSAHERNIRHALACLERLQLIERVGDSKGGRGRAVVYRLTIPPWLQKGGGSATLSDAKGWRTGAVKGGATATPPIKRPGDPQKGAPSGPPSWGPPEPPPPHLAAAPNGSRTAAAARTATRA